MRIMNPYLVEIFVKTTNDFGNTSMINSSLVETFVKTTSSHHNITNNFGNTSINWFSWPKRYTQSNTDEKPNTGIKYDAVHVENLLKLDLAEIRKQDHSLWFHLCDLARSLRLKRVTKDYSPDKKWAKKNGIGEFFQDTEDAWWKSLKPQSRLACYEYIRGK